MVERTSQAATLRGQKVSRRIPNGCTGDDVVDDDLAAAAKTPLSDFRLREARIRRARSSNRRWRHRRCRC